MAEVLSLDRILCDIQTLSQTNNDDQVDIVFVCVCLRFNFAFLPIDRQISDHEKLRKFVFDGPLQENKELQNIIFDKMKVTPRSPYF